ncbi:MAG: hypothetical protein KJ949_02405 [Nanoarchaeota archaeon]|nr:hypothetical protein [Nanoarchaeota archaeon]MBU4308324.1 hypothetical protein [Nanoarchaeota archaeon]
MIQNSKLTQILEKDKNGKPIFNLILLEKTVVYVPTKESYDELMRVCERGGLKWAGGNLPTKNTNNFRNCFGEEICINLDKTFSRKSTEGKIKVCDKSFYQKKGYKIISPQEFYNAQNPKITPEILKEVNEYFERIKN